MKKILKKNFTIIMLFSLFAQIGNLGIYTANANVAVIWNMRDIYLITDSPITEPILLNISPTDANNPIQSVVFLWNDRLEVVNTPTVSIVKDWESYFITWTWIWVGQYSRRISASTSSTYWFSTATHSNAFKFFVIRPEHRITIRKTWNQRNSVTPEEILWAVNLNTAWAIGFDLSNITKTIVEDDEITPRTTLPNTSWTNNVKVRSSAQWWTFKIINVPVVISTAASFYVPRAVVQNVRVWDENIDPALSVNVSSVLADDIKTITWLEKPSTQAVANNVSWKVRVTYIDDSYDDVNVTINVVTRSYSISFSGETITKSPVLVQHGQKLPVFINPTRAWYKFLGWKKQWETWYYDFETIVNSDFELVAEWEKLLEVTFKNEDDSVITTLSKEQNTTILDSEKPANPTKTGWYTFLGWTTDGQTIFDFTQALTTDVILKPKFEEIQKSWIIINEIGYRNTNDSEIKKAENNLDFVEIYNPTGSDIDISWVRIVDKTDSTDNNPTTTSKIIIPDWTILRAWEYYVASRWDALFNTKYGISPSITGKLNLWHTWGESYFVQLADKYDRELDRYDWQGEGSSKNNYIFGVETNEKILDNTSFCKINWTWGNCLTTPGSENKKSDGNINLSNNSLNHNVSWVEVWDLSSTWNLVDTSYTYTLETTNDWQFFEIVNNKLKLKDSVTTDYFTKNSYAIKIAVKWNRWAYKVIDFTVNVVEPVFSLTHRFVSSDSSKTLPQEIVNKTPATISNKRNSEVVPAWTFDNTAVSDSTLDWVWTFDSWNESSHTVNRADFEFVWTWNFTANKHSVTYNFVPENNNLTLPSEVLALKPENIVNQKIKWDVVNVSNITDEVVITDTANPANTWTWTFVSWDKNTETIWTSDIVFTWTWKFTPKSAKIISEFRSATSRSLPTEVSNLLPVFENVIYGAIVAKKNFSSVALATGTWLVESSEIEDVDNIVNKDIEKIIYTWTFTPRSTVLKYSFKNISTIKTELPQVVTDLKPQDKATTFESVEICQQPAQTRIEVSDGYWNFKNFTRNSITIESIEEICEANWDFEYKKSTIEYTYESITNGKTLPENIVNSKPANEEVNFASNKTATEPQQKTFEVEDGTWNFVEYTPASLIVDENKETFTGKWKFTPSVVENENDKLPNFVSVTFVSEEIKGTLSNTLTFWVNPDKNITLTAPTVTAKTGYTFASWDKNISGNFLQNTTINAVYTTTIPTVENKVIKLSENIPAVDEFITNKTNLPNGATFAWEWWEPVKNINSLEKISKNIVARYQDGSVYTFPVEITFIDDIVPTIDDISNISAVAWENINEIGLITADNIAVVDTQVSGLPNGLNFVNGKISGTVDVNAEIKTYNVTIIVKDAANNSITKNFAIDLASQSSKYNPQAKKQTIEVKNEINPKNSIENVDTLPQGTNFAWKTGTEPDNQVIGTNISTKVIVTYPDNSTDEVDVILDIVDTTKPILSGIQNATMKVGSDESKNYVLNSEIIVSDNYDTNLTVNCTSNPSYNANKVWIYVLTCTAQDSSGNISENFSKNIVIEGIDKQKLRELLDSITNDFNTNPDKITNLDIGNTAKDEIQKALDNPDLTADELDRIFEKLKDTKANRDTTSPNATITADVTDPTNGNVTLTLTVDEPLKTIPDWWTQDPTNPLVYTKVVSDNENIALEVEDNYGNKTPITHSVNNIDKQKPTGHIIADITDPTNGNVTLTITVDEPIDTPDGWTKVDDKTFTKTIENNQNVEVILRDPAGNETKLAYNVDNIDKTPPSGEITGEPTDWINNNVKLTLTTTKPVETPQGWTKVSDTVFEKILEENSTGEFILTDNVGNNSTAKVAYNVSKIDKEKPVVTTLTVEWDKTLIQSATVIVNFTGTDTGGSDIKEYQCKIGNEDFVPCSSPFTFNNLVEWENIISVRLVDNAGNISDNKDISITKDSTAPIFVNLSDKEFDEDSIITPIVLESDGVTDRILVKNLPVGLAYDENTKTISWIPAIPGKYTIDVEAIDEAGNSVKDTFVITIRDITPPTITLNSGLTETLVKWKPYTEAWATCTDNVDTSCVVEIIGTIDNKVLWEQTITYKATDRAGNVNTITKKVTVVTGETPIITITGNATEFVELWGNYVDAGATAFDNEDQDITASIITNNSVYSNTLGTYTVTYNVTDSSENSAPQMIRQVIVHDTTKPIITDISNKDFNEKTPITSIDVEVLDLNPILNIVVNGLPTGLSYNATTRQIEGQSNIVGIHDITIVATDWSGNISEKSFKIEIKDITPPIVDIWNLEVINLERVSSYKFSWKCNFWDNNLEINISWKNFNNISCEKDWTYNFIWDLSDLEDSENIEISVKQSDKAWNVSEISKKIIKKDTTSPVINLDNIKVSNWLNWAWNDLIKESSEKYSLSIKLWNWIEFDSFLAKVLDEKFDEERNISDLKDISSSLNISNQIIKIKEIWNYEFIFKTKDSVWNESKEVIFSIKIDENDKKDLEDQIKKAEEKIKSTSLVDWPSKDKYKEVLDEAKKIFSNPNATKEEIDDILKKFKEIEKTLDYAFSPWTWSNTITNDNRVLPNEVKTEPIKEEIKEEVIITEIPKENVVIEPFKNQVKEIDWKQKIYEVTWKYSSCPMIPNIVWNYNENYKVLFEDIDFIKNLDEVQRLTKVWVLNEKWVNNTMLFEPNRWITRAEFLAIVLQVHCYDVSKNPESLPYYDVDLDTWQARVIKVANEIWIIVWYEKDENWIPFRPNDQISKIEAFGIMMKMAELKNSEEFEDSYTDKKAPWQSKPLSAWEYLWILRPEDTSYKFYPDSKLNRNDMVKLIVDIVRLY